MNKIFLTTVAVALIGAISMAGVSSVPDTPTVASFDVASYLVCETPENRDAALEDLVKRFAQVAGCRVEDVRRQEYHLSIGKLTPERCAVVQAYMDGRRDQLLHPFEFALRKKAGT